MLDDNEFLLENAQFEVYIENSRWKCIVNSSDTKQERVRVRGKDFETKYLYIVDEVVNTDKIMQREHSE